jgi:hypothetical protein
MCYTVFTEISSELKIITDHGHMNTPVSSVNYKYAVLTHVLILTLQGRSAVNSIRKN